MRTFVVSCLWCLWAGVVCAQQLRPWETYLNEVMTQEDAESDLWEETYDLLCELEQHPIDINRASREQLEQLPFLSAQQIEGIVEYLYRYGPLKSLAELQMIAPLDYAQRQLLTYFIYIGEEQSAGFPSMKQIARYGQHELIATGRIPFYERKGDKNGYLGYPYRHWLRYQFTYGDWVKAGIVGAQDAGEPFGAKQNKVGYDYYSFYLQLRGLGLVESLVVGNYRVSMGMGLVMNSDFSLGKVALLQNLGRMVCNLRAHSSQQNTYLRGTAATLALGEDLKLTGFVSYRPADATLNKDSTAATILETGYHRTESEMEKKHNLDMLKTGGSLRYDAHGLHLGMNAVYTHLDRELKPNANVLYRQHYPQGRDFMNLSLDYGYASPRVALRGETAMDKSGHLATINTASLRIGDAVSVMALQRFYSYAYSSLDAQSYSDGGRVQNESGIYLGLTLQPSQAFRLVAYTDYAYFAWAKYQVSQSSYSWDNLLQCEWQRRAWTFSGRYRLRLKQKDNADKTALDNHLEHRARLTASYAGSILACRTQLDAAYLPDSDGAWGAMVSESLSYTHRWLRLNASAGYFHTDNYGSRVYLYEQGPLYTYAMTQFYGEGIRYWLMARATIGRRLSLTTKIGITDYFNRSTIGSSYQQIDASSMTDLDLQVRWKL